MADQKLTELTEDTDPTIDDLLYSVHDPGGTPVERKITIENLLKNLTPGTFVDRGDASAWDWDHTDLTEDGNWNDLDCSSIVPAGAKFILFKVYIQDDAANSSFSMRKNGATGTHNSATQKTQVANQDIREQWLIPCDEDRIIEYQATNTTWTGIYLLVLGWFTNVTDSVLGYSDKYVHRGDPSSHDWTEPDLTTDGVFYELDCSSIVPAGATAIHLRLVVQDDAVGSSLVFKKNGQTNNINVVRLRTQQTSSTTDADVIVACDENRKIEYRTDNLTYTGIYITVRGWFMGSADVALDYAPNELVNPEFNIWQEGTTINATSTPANNDDTYVCDQWILLSDGNDVVDVSRASTSPPTRSKYYLRAEVETASKKFGFLQPIENLNSIKYEDEKASLSFKVKGTLDNCRAAIISWDGTADTITSDIISAWAAEGTNPTLATNWTYENTPSNLALTTSWVEHKIEDILIDTSGMKNLAVFIWVDDADGAVDEYIEIGQVKLELNSVCTKFIPLSFDKEIERCQRYFEKSYNIDTVPGTATDVGRKVILETESQTNTMGETYEFKVNKMKNPTMNAYDLNGNKDKATYDGSSHNQTITVVSASIGEAGFYVTSDGTTSKYMMTFHFIAAARL